MDIFGWVKYELFSQKFISFEVFICIVVIFSMYVRQSYSDFRVWGSSRTPPPTTFLGLTNTKNECFDWFIYIEYLLHLKSVNYKYDLNLMHRIFINLEFT